MGGLEIVGCVAVIVIGVAVIAYILLRTPKKPASFGDTPSIELGEVPTTEGDGAAASEEAEITEKTSEAERSE